MGDAISAAIKADWQMRYEIWIVGRHQFTTGGDEGKRLINIAPFLECCKRVSRNALNQVAILIGPCSAITKPKLVGFTMRIGCMNLEPVPPLIINRSTIGEPEHGPDVVFSLAKLKC